MADKDYYSAKDLAALAGVTPEFIRQEIKAGKIRNASKKFGRDWVIPVSDGNAWLDKRRNK